MTLVRSRSLLAFSLLCAGTISAQACVNDDPVEEDEDGGAGGSPATGGTDAGTGGTTGSAECDNGANFEAHVEEQVTDRCLTANVPNCNITDFTAATYDAASGDWGDEQSLTGETFSYTGPDTTLDFGVAEGTEELNIAASVAGDSYAGVGLSFGPCTDARDFDGLQVTIGGVLAEGGIFDIQLQTDENYPLGEDAEGNIGTCPAADLITGDQSPWDVCQNNYFRTVGINPDESITYYIPWAEFTGGQPNAINPQQLRGVQMQLGCDVALAPCASELQIYDIRFYRDHDAFLGPEEGMGGAGN